MCAFGWLAHSRNARLRLFTEDTRSCDTILRLARSRLGGVSSLAQISPGLAGVYIEQHPEEKKAPLLQLIVRFR
jgi:hypothetical protein